MENIIKNRGRTSGYKLDRGGVPSESGPFVGLVMNNIDPTRNGRIQVWIDEFGKNDKNDPTGWRTISYMTPYYGKVAHNGTTEGVGTSVGNAQSYGMWFNTPDVGTKVMCFFINGDPNYGYYVGYLPENGLTHMIPAIADNVTEINHKNKEISEDPRFYDQNKPQHSSVVATMYQQGLKDDTVRGPISSTVQRESPSAVFGISTPGRPVYRNGMYDTNVKETLENGEVELQDVDIIGRRGGHSFVMDDGDLEGNNQMMRLRTSHGHQITMSDDGECLYITHANGQSWVELGKGGTVDVYSSNSINMRTQGTLNLHADEDININAGGNLNMKADTNIEMGGTEIHLNKDGASTVPGTSTTYTDIELTDDGWKAEETASLASIATRVPTHEPYSAHNGSVTQTTNPVDRDKLNKQVTTLINNQKVQPPKYT